MLTKLFLFVLQAFLLATVPKPPTTQVTATILGTTTKASPTPTPTITPAPTATTTTKATPTPTPTTNTTTATPIPPMTASTPGPVPAAIPPVDAVPVDTSTPIDTTVDTSADTGGTQDTSSDQGDTSTGSDQQNQSSDTKATTSAPSKKPTPSPMKLRRDKMGRIVTPTPQSSPIPTQTPTKPSSTPQARSLSSIFHSLGLEGPAVFIINSLSKFIEAQKKVTLFPF